MALRDGRRTEDAGRRGGRGPIEGQGEAGDGTEAQSGQGVGHGTPLLKMIGYGPL